ncbi:uncharacterized protein [Narcine bancroftii]|uniref:uncharacterized protein n=1 Tax=Narcine bancroftii TaxID=1343680 RepID=UPI003831CCF2
MHLQAKRTDNVLICKTDIKKLLWRIARMFPGQEGFRYRVRIDPLWLGLHQDPLRLASFFSCEHVPTQPSVHTLRERNGAEQNILKSGAVGTGGRSRGNKLFVLRSPQYPPASVWASPLQLFVWRQKYVCGLVEVLQEFSARMYCSPEQDERRKASKPTRCEGHQSSLSVQCDRISYLWTHFIQVPKKQKCLLFGSAVSHPLQTME